MSHNILLDNVRFSDIATLTKIVNSLSKGNARVDMSAKTFRTYQGQPNKCEGAIILPGRHDVGLVKHSAGGWTPIFDPFTMDRILAAEFSTSPIGALLQEYALQEAEYEAAQQGMSATRIPGERGLVTLELVAA